jgi:hypothetical protein
MTTQIILLFTLLFYSIVASQSISYIISLTDVQQKMNVNEYIVFRKLTDKNFRLKFTKVVYAILLLNPALVIITIIHFNILLLVCAGISLLAFVIDVLLTVKGNLPINDIINTWSTDNYPSNWTEYREKWFGFFRLRQIANLIGFVSLLVGAVFS